MPIKDLSKLTEIFRQRVIKLFVEKKLLNKEFAKQLLKWKHSGFSVDNSVWILASNDKAGNNICQYIARHPVSLKKIEYVKSKGTVPYHTRYSEYWGENVKLFKAKDFIADLTTHIPAKHKHLIRYYGLYSSRGKGMARKDGKYKKFVILGNPSEPEAKNNTNYSYF